MSALMCFAPDTLLHNTPRSTRRPFLCLWLCALTKILKIQGQVHLLYKLQHTVHFGEFLPLLSSPAPHVGNNPAKARSSWGAQQLRLFRTVLAREAAPPRGPVEPTHLRMPTSSPCDAAARCLQPHRSVCHPFNITAYLLRHQLHLSPNAPAKIV